MATAMVLERPLELTGNPLSLATIV